jgi:hypothetical protein
MGGKPMALRWICAVAIFTALSSQAIAEEQPKSRFLARARRREGIAKSRRRGKAVTAFLFAS